MSNSLPGQSVFPVMPPWVYHIRSDGRLEKVTPVRYAEDYNLDKPSILLAVMEKLPQRLVNDARRP